MARARTLTIAVIAIIVLVALEVAFVVLISRVAGDPVIVIENASSHPLRQIECTLFADGTTWTERRDGLEPNDDLEFSKSTSDLYIQSVQYEFQGELRQWQGGGIATTGETFRLRIGNQGEVSASYDP